MKIVKADGRAEFELIAAVRGRSAKIDRDVTASVREIMEGVRQGGDEALLGYCEKFDGVRPERLEITKAELEAACERVPEKVIVSLKRAAENIRSYHEHQKRESFVITRKDGVVMGQRVRALKRVGLYVPGGKAAYPSSVLMNAIPAKVAGVDELIMVTPPSKNGVDPTILAAAAIAGVDRVFAVGGAQAVAALAYGTATVPKVDKIVGPGNIYVATAKKLSFGEVDIDMIAGPSEILVVADETAEPEYLAADLMSQAEHDPMACAVLLTDNEDVAVRTLAELDRQKKTLSRRDIIERSLEDFGMAIVCEDIAKCLELANDIAPEHLELMTKDPMQLLGAVDNAGSVFLGRYSPEPLGDYFAGPNHVLPTSGTARFFSPLSVDTFIKKSSFIYYTRDALKEGADDIVTLARAEGLTAHANSVEVRFRKKILN
jgi:histidinol dehydrogenase